MTEADTALDSYDFELPEELIAQQPPESREDARLLLLPRREGPIGHRGIRDLAEILRDGDLLVFNRTRVIPARAFGKRTISGGRVEVLVLDGSDEGSIEALMKTRGRPEIGELFDFFEGQLQLELKERGERGRVRLARRSEGRPLVELLSEFGHMPLPPYIRRRNDEEEAARDRKRYQTVFASEPGAVAAPTAGLHFSQDLLNTLEACGVQLAWVTLHVGLGTFRPIVAEDIREHRMHSEHYEVPKATALAVSDCRARGGRVIAVGTTSLRSLESAFEDEAVQARSGSTDLFLYPGRPAKSVDGLLTNFHLPKSSLLLLVSCLAGRERVLASYREAVAQRYRFFSYGDAMLIL